MALLEARWLMETLNGPGTSEAVRREVGARSERLRRALRRLLAEMQVATVEDHVADASLLVADAAMDEILPMRFCTLRQRNELLGHMFEDDDGANVADTWLAPQADLIVAGAFSLRKLVVALADLARSLDVVENWAGSDEAADV